MSGKRSTPAKVLTPKQRFGRRLALAREAAGLSRTGLARTLKGSDRKDTTQVRHWEEGEFKNGLRSDTLAALSTATQASVDWLLGLKGTDDKVIRSDVDVPRVDLEPHLAQYVRSAIARLARDGAFDVSGPVGLDRESMEADPSAWPIDGAAILNRLIERETAALREWLEWHNTEMMLRMLAADLRKSLTTVAPHVRRKGADDELTGEYRVAAGALQGLMHIAAEMKAPIEPPIRPPRLFRWASRTPTTARNPVEVMDGYRAWLAKHTASEYKGWPRRRHQEPRTKSALAANKTLRAEWEAAFGPDVIGMSPAESERLVAFARQTGTLIEGPPPKPKRTRGSR